MAPRGSRRIADLNTSSEPEDGCRLRRSAAVRTRRSRRWVARPIAAMLVAVTTVSSGAFVGRSGSAVGAEFAPHIQTVTGDEADTTEPPAQLPDGWWKGTQAAKGWRPRPTRLPATSDRPVDPLPDPFAPNQPPVATIVIQVPEVSPAPEHDTTPSVSDDRATRPAASRITRPRPPELWEKPARSGPRVQLDPSHPITAAARSSQLAESAVDLLRRAHWSARRGAVHSARDAAWETMRTIAALRDTQAGDNRHTVWLGEAATAIAESADFNGRFGAVDPATLSRLIEVHETEVLYGVDTKTLTPARAVEAYLDWAQQQLVAAIGGGPLATEATMILAELQASGDGLLAGTEASPRQAASHAAELALMYRRAAFQIDPHHPGAAAALGRTLLARSLPEMAKPYLQRSVAAAATRQNVESLLRAAELTHDERLVQKCRQELQQAELPSELPVERLSPQQFAATHWRMTDQARLIEPYPSVSKRPERPFGDRRSNAAASQMPAQAGLAAGKTTAHGKVTRRTMTRKTVGRGPTARDASARDASAPRVARRQRVVPGESKGSEGLFGSQGLSPASPISGVNEARRSSSREMERRIVDPARDVSTQRRGWFW